MQGHDGFVVLLGLWQVQSQVDVFAPNDGHMLVLDELDIAGSHEPVDHEANEPMQVQVDLPVLLKNLPAASVFFRELVRHCFANSLPCKTHKVSVFGNSKASAWLVRDLDDWELGNVANQAAAVCVCKDLANGNHVLMNCCGTQIPIAHHLHKVRQLPEANLVHAHVPKVRQDAVVHSIQKDGDVGCCKFASLDPCLQTHNNAWNQIGKLDLSVTACLNPIRIQLSSLDVKELLGLTDSRLFVRGLQALRVGLALEITTHLPIPAGVGLEDTQLAGVVSNGRDGRQYGQSAVTWREIVGVICCLLPCQILHSCKRSFGQTVRATGI